MKHVYMEFWRTNGNVAALWHLGVAVMFLGCIAMVIWGDRLDRQRDKKREYPENTDRHIY